MNPEILIVNTLFICSLVGGERTHEDQTEVAILKQVNRVNDDGSYTFGYEAADGSFKIETRDVRGNVKGMFGYVDTSGDLKKVSYSSSNSTGFVQTTENTSASASEREALLASFGTSAPASDRSDRKPILVLRDSALVAPTKSSFIQYIPKKTESSYFGAREYSTPAYETSSAQSRNEVINQNEDLFVNPDSLDSEKFKSLSAPVAYPRKIVVTRRPVEENRDNYVISRGGNALRRQLSHRLNEREEDGVHVYGNEIMNSNYYDKPMDAHSVIRENAEAERAGGSHHAPSEGVRYEILEPKYRENRAGYVSVPIGEDIDRTIVYPNPNAYNAPTPAAGYRPRAPVHEPDDYRPNYPVTPPPQPPPPAPYSPYSATFVQSLRDELMEFIMQYVHRRLNPYFQDYQTPYQNPYRNPPPPLPYTPNYPYPNPNYPPRNYPPQVPPYFNSFVGAGAGPGPGLGPYPVPNFPYMSPNIQYSTQSPGGTDGESNIVVPQVKALRGRAGYVRRPLQFPPSVRENRDSRENRRQNYLYRPLATAGTTRESSTIQAAASTTSSTTVAAPNNTPVRNIQILGTTPSPVLGDSRPVTESPDEMEATS